MDNFHINRISYESEDYDEFASMLKNANVEQKLMETGSFHGSLEMVSSKNIIVSNFNISRRVLQLGTSKPGYITFVIWDPRIFFNWRKRELTQEKLGILWNKEHQSVTGAGFNGLPISIEENYFSKLCQDKGYPELFARLKKNDLLNVSEGCLFEIRQLVKFVTRNKYLNNNIVHELIEEKLVGTLINCLVGTLPEKANEKLTYSKFSNAIDYIHSNLTDITSVNQISENIKIPERTLRRLFQEKYKLSPKNYLNTLRLNEVRKELKNDSDSSSIFEVASEYNYWHMGQFTRDYKKLFGELPSDTLRSH